MALRGAHQSRKPISRTQSSCGVYLLVLPKSATFIRIYGVISGKYLLPARILSPSLRATELVPEAHSHLFTDRLLQIGPQAIIESDKLYIENVGLKDDLDRYIVDVLPDSLGMLIMPSTFYDDLTKILVRKMPEELEFISYMDF